MVGNEGTFPASLKVKSLQEMDAPNTVGEVRVFISTDIVFSEGLYSQF